MNDALRNRLPLAPGPSPALLVIARRIARARGMHDAQIRELIQYIKKGRYYNRILDRLEERLPDTFAFSGDPRKSVSKHDYSDLNKGAPEGLEDLHDAAVLVAEMNDMNAAGLLTFNTFSSATS